MLECSDIPKRVNWRRLEIEGEVKKIKMHRKMCINAHFSVHRSFYSNVAKTTVQNLFALIKILIMQLSYYRYD